MNHTVAAESRQGTGKSVTRKLRAAGRIPANIYGTDGNPRSLTLDPAPLLEIFRKTQNRNTVIHLDVDGESVPVLVKEAQRHPVSRDVLHIDFFRLAPGQVVEVMVPVNAVGRPAGAAIGGKVHLYRRDLKVACAWEQIPATLDIDVTPLEIGDTIRASAVPMAEGTSVVFDRDFPVAICAGKKK
jgi:large subunit ribosomal protein L25